MFDSLCPLNLICQALVAASLSVLCAPTNVWAQQDSTQEESTQEKSSQRNDRKLSPVYPLLKAHDWNAKPLCVYKNYNGIDKAPIPLIACAVETVDDYQVVTTQAAEKAGLSKEQLFKEAQRHIDAYEAKWEVVQGFMLTASGKPFSAEKILCREFLIEAQKKLKAKRVLVAAPRRTILYAIDADVAAEKLDVFREVLSKTLKDDAFGNQYISPLAFRFQDGELVGAMIIRDADE